MNSKKLIFKLSGLWGIWAVSSFLTLTLAHAYSLDSISTALSFPSLSGDAATKYNAKLGFELDARISDAFFGMPVAASVNYHALAIQNFTNAKIHEFGFFIGPEWGNTVQPARVRLGLATQLGGVWNSFSVSGSTGATLNHAAVFSFRCMPHVEVPLIQSLSLYAAMPVTWVFDKKSLTLWAMQTGLNYQF